MRDFAVHTTQPMRYGVAFINCFKTGVYTCIFLFPVILIILSFGLPLLGMVDELGRFDEEAYQTGFLIFMLIEIFASVLIISFVAAFIPGMIQTKK